MEESIVENKKIDHDNTCLNCGFIFENNENFCPNCGQINDNQRVTFRHLLIDVLGYFFFYDYRLKNSLKLMLFKPGQLSLNFIRGKKADYIHPIRLYFIVSLIFFALASINTDDDNTDDNFVNIEVNEQDTTQVESPKIASLFGVKDTSVVDSIVIEEAKTSKFGLIRLFMIEKSNHKAISKDEVFKKYGIESTVINNYVFSKAMYSLKTDLEDLFKVIEQKFKLVIFIFLPFFVVFMFLFHYRKDYYYYENLIFAFNTQTALFLLLITGELLSFFNNDIGSYISIFIFFIAFPVYLYIALKRFYGYNSHWRALFNFVIINALFIVLSLLFFIISFISIYLIS